MHYRAIQRLLSLLLCCVCHLSFSDFVYKLSLLRYQINPFIFFSFFAVCSSCFLIFLVLHWDLGFQIPRKLKILLSFVSGYLVNIFKYTQKLFEIVDFGDYFGRAYLVSDLVHDLLNWILYSSSFSSFFRFGVTNSFWVLFGFAEITVLN